MEGIQPRQVKFHPTGLFHLRSGEHRAVEGHGPAFGPGGVLRRRRRRRRRLLRLPQEHPDLQV